MDNAEVANLIDQCYDTVEMNLRKAYISRDTELIIFNQALIRTFDERLKELGEE